jgi:hypothetical protein
VISSTQGPTLSPTDTDFSNVSHDEYTSSVSSGSPPTEYETTFYYSGISHSPPKLVYRTSKVPFVRPRGPEAYRRLKYLCPIYDHKLGDKWELTKMCPRRGVPLSFEYPLDRLLELRDILAEDRIGHPDTKDCDGENCLFVIKRGLTTFTTIGRANGFLSCAREYFPNQTHRDSIEWAILPYDNESGAFSKSGDSGSMIVSGSGKFGGIITGGSGVTEPSDITYATPMFWLWPIIKARFPNADLYPVFN